MFKFKIGDQVTFVYGSVFSPNPDGVYQAVVNGGKIIARKDYGSGRGPEYRVAGFSGWWAEENLGLVLGGLKSSSSRDEASSPCTLQGEVTKCDTEDSGDSEDLWSVIAELSEIRAGYNLFSEKERAKYHALTVAINKLREEA